MAITFPTNGLVNGQVYEPPGLPGVKYTYNAVKQVWVGAQAGTGTSVSNYVLPTAGVGTGGTLGGVKVDGSSVTINSGVISAATGGPIAVLDFDTNPLDPPWTTSASLPALTIKTAVGATVTRVAGSTPGRYLVTFTLTRPNANYVAIVTLGWNASHSPPDTWRDNASYYILNQTAANFEIYVNDENLASARPMDTDNIGVAVFDATSVGGGGGSASASAGDSSVFAWVNFNGITAPPTIRGAFNVGSVKKIDNGNYEISFGNQLPDSNYAVLVSTNNGDAGDGWALLDTATVAPTRTLFRIGTGKQPGSGYRDREFVNVVVYRGSGGIGYTGSSSTGGGTGYNGSVGYTGSRGFLGYTGSAGVDGYTGSAGIGYTGSASTVGGYTGSVGYSGSVGYTGSAGYSGSAGIGYTGSASTVGGYTGSVGYTGSAGYSGSAGIGYTGSASTVGGYTGSVGYSGSAGYTGSVGYSGSIGYTGSIGLGSRATVTVTTVSVANSASTTASITGFKGYNLYKVYSSHAAWIRIYTTIAARTSDSSRLQGTDPTPDVGIVAEVITISAGQTITLAPAVLGFNDESPASDIIPIAVTNLSAATVAITVTLTLVQTEI
jgi:hypothetical protein